ncbi:MAG: tandem-95 repeat protein [Oxalobacteraceae bacterium]
MLFSKPGEGAGVLSLGLQRFAGIPKPLADVMGAVGELALRYVPIANLAQAVKFLFGGYITGQALGSSSSPLPAFDADSAYGPAQPGWERKFLRQDTLGLPPIVIDTNSLDGTIVTRFPDGRSMEVHKDGTQILTHPDSGMAVIRTDKSGFLVLKDTDPVTGDTLTSTVIIDPSTIVSFENQHWVTRRFISADTTLIEQTTYEGNRTVTEDVRINQAADGKIISLQKSGNTPFVSYLPPDTQSSDDSLRTYQVAIPIAPDHIQLVRRDEDRRLVQTVDITTVSRYRTEKIFRDGDGNLQQTSITERINDSTTRTRVLDSEGNEIENTVSQTYRHHGEVLTLEDRSTSDGRRTFTTRDNEGKIRQTEIATQDAKPAELTDVLREELHQDIASFLTALRQKDTAGMILSTARIALDYARSERLVSGPLEGIVGDVSSGLALVNSLHSIRSGDTLARVGGTVGLLNSTNYQAANHFGGAYLSGAQTTALSTAGAILSIASLAKLGDMLEAGQVGSAAATVVSALNAISYLSRGTSLMGAGALVPINPIAMVVAAYVLDQIFASDPPPPPPVGTARFVREADGRLSYRIVQANPLGRSILQKRLDELLPKLESQIAAANAVITDPAHQLQLVASRMPVIHISSWPSYNENGVSNFYFAIEQADPMRDTPNWMGVARQDLVEHYGEMLLLPEALVQQWEIDHLRSKFGIDEAHWQTESAWLRAQSPIEQERSRLQAAFERAQDEWKALSAAKLVSSELGSVMSDSHQTDSLHTLEARRKEARLQMEAARSTVDEFNAAHPVDPTLAARATPEQEAEFARTHAARDTVALQWTRVIAIDIAGDGIAINELPGEVGSDLQSITHQQVARFDVDGDGYREATQWISPADALLGIDRSGNGVLDNGSELFNAADVPFDQHGLPSLAYFDANGDGLINRDDPVYSLLRLWVDLDGDGSSGSLEVFDMNLRPVGLSAGLSAAPLSDQPRSPMAIDAINLRSDTVNFADGSHTGISTVNLLSHVKGLQIVQDQATANLNVLHEDGLRENFVTMVEDMSALAELQSATLSPQRRTELQALAKRYGLNPDAKEFADIVRSLRSAAASTDPETVIYFGDDDVWIDPSFREQLAQMRIRFRRLNDPSSIAGDDQLARFGTPLQTQAVTNTSAFDDRWVQSRKVSAADIQSDPVKPAPESPSTAEQIALPSDVYSLLHITKGAQEGSLVTRQAIPVSDPSRPESPATKIDAYITPQPLARFAPLELVMHEDATLKVGYAQLEQRAAALLGRIAGQVRLLGIRSSAHGTVLVDDAQARLQFRPDTNYVGDAHLTVVLADALGRVFEQRLNLKLLPVNDAPVVLGESIASHEDMPLLIDSAMLLANDRDPEGDALSVTGIGHVALGKAELLANGMIHYTPPTDQYGVTDTVEYFVSDPHGATSVGRIRIALSPVDDAPSVVSERVIHAREDQVMRIAAPLLLANDFDTDTDARAGSQALRITGVGSPEHGEVRLEESDIVFRPERNYNGMASFSYTVTDASGHSTTGRSQIRIDPVTDTPLLADETIAATEDQPLIIDTALLLANDIDTDILRGEDQTLSIVAIDQVDGGTARLRDGQIVFTPEANRVGPAGLRYTVSDGAGGLAQGHAEITLAPVNDAPVVPVLHGCTEEDQPLSISIADLLKNATDVDDDHASLRITGLGKVTGGTALLQNDGLHFTPEKDYAGSAMIEYQVADAQGLETTGLYTVDISGINDAPRPLDGVHLSPVADEDQEIRISESALLQLFIDPDGDPIRLLPESLRALASGDRVSFDAQRREMVFRAAPNANGERGVSFAVSDGTLTSQAATLKLQLRPVNDTPEVKAVGFQMLEDGGETDPTKSAWTYISHDLLLAGATDVDGDTLHIISASAGRTLGEVQLRAVTIQNDALNRRIMVKAPLNYVGALSFGFTVSDGKGGETSQTAIGSIQAVNDNPFISSVFQGAERMVLLSAVIMSYTYSITAWDPDQNQSIGLKIDRNPLRGNVTLKNSPSFKTAPVPGAEIDSLASFEKVNSTSTLTIIGGAGSLKSQEQVWIKATDSAGGSSTTSVSFTAYYDPIVIDLDNDGLEFIDLYHSQVSFITDDSGEAHRIAWVGGDDGILAYDVDGDGQINRFDEIAFGSHVDPQTPGISDLQALQHIEFDSNQDGVFDASDDKWHHFKLWRDMNSNGKSDDGELQTMPQAGLRQLYLNGNVLNRFEGPDALVRGYTRAVTNEGRLLQAADVWLNVDDGSRANVAPAPLREASAMEGDQLEVLLKQLAATPTGSNHPPLLYGYLPTQYADEGEFFHLDIAPNLFIDPDMEDRLIFTATLADGSALPDWLSFDAERLRFEGVPSETDAAQLQIVLRATDPQQAGTDTLFNLVVSPAINVADQTVTLDNSAVQPLQELSWNALLPMEVWLAATTASATGSGGIASTDSWPTTFAALPTDASLQETTMSEATAITAPEQIIAELYQDFVRGTADNDTYDFRPGDGSRNLLDPGGEDLIRIDLPEAESALHFERQGSDLSLSFTGTNDGLRIAGWYDRDDSGAAVHQIERFELTDGRTLLASNVDKLIAAQSVNGTTTTGQFWR